MTASAVKSLARFCSTCGEMVVEEPAWFKCGCGFSFTLTITGSDPLLKVQTVEANAPRGMP